MRLWDDTFSLQANELSFDEGDLLYVYDKDADSHWWTVKCGDQKGLVPVTYG